MTISLVTGKEQAVAGCAETSDSYRVYPPCLHGACMGLPRGSQGASVPTQGT